MPRRRRDPRVPAPFFFRALFLAAALPAAACAFVGDGAYREEGARALARDAGWRETVVAADAFRLVLFEPAGRPQGATLRVYIEGDGYAWRDRWTPSRDPTPKEPVALRLAIADPRPGAVYLARPCQFPRLTGMAQCDPAYWTGARFAPVVIRAYETAIRELSAARGTTSVALVGHSGGGVIAAHVAASLDTVRMLVTVAAPLDLDAWTRHHGVSDFPADRNPRALADRLGAVRQWHILGAADDIVPPATAAGFRTALPPGAPARFETLQDLGHDCCLHDRWAALVGRDWTVRTD